ncbi:hypothetical protein HBB16_02440 [Pseudonocardia sp. MCCB 268]|nr:hypothetical protein [Pseudonocardia cytotoxica]
MDPTPRPTPEQYRRQRRLVDEPRGTSRQPPLGDPVARSRPALAEDSLTTTLR